jgi:hypothetical protein
MRTTHRTRRQVGPFPLFLLRPFLRFSNSRDAYILRFVGARTGPVLQRRRSVPPAARRRSVSS